MVAFCEETIRIFVPVVMDVGFISTLNLPPPPYYVCAQCDISPDIWPHLVR